MIPKNISKEHLEKAIDEVEKNGIRKGRHSSTYNIINNGKQYPPKLIISIANRYANGVELDPNKFEGGKGTPAFKLLESCNFELVEKKHLKDIIKDCQLSFYEITEKHKSDYRQIFNREKDWLKNVEDKTFRLSENVQGDIEYIISKLKEEGYNFKESDNEKLSLFISQINGIIRIANRINNFKEGTKLDNNQKLKLFELFNSIKSSHQFNDFDFTLNKNLKSFIVHLYSVVKHCQSPDKYPIYYKYWKNILGEILKKDDNYDSLCSFYQAMPSPKHISLGTYFGTIGTVLARKISENQIIKEEGDKNYKYIRNKILNIHYFDIITGYKRQPNYYIIGSKYGENNDIDVFPKMLENNFVSVGFAPHLDLSDFYLTDDAEIIEYLKEENEAGNSYNALKLFLNIKAGDKVAIKASGSPRRKKGFLSIVGIFEIVQNKDGEVYSHDPDGLGHNLNVKVVDAPIYKEFEIGGYGSTVHKLSNQDHISQIFNHTNKKGSIFLETKDKFENSVFEKYIKFLRKINSELGLMPNDERVVYSVKDNRLNFIVGQRYCFNLYLNSSRGNLGVISKKKLFKNSEPYDGNPPQPFYNYFQDFEYPSNNDLDSITEAIKDEINRTTKSGFIRHNNLEFENYVFEIKSSKSNNEKNMKFPLNTILYGPPGTGKTYNTILRAAQIIENRVIDSYDEALKIFKMNLYSRIEFITFHQNYSYEDFIQGLRPETDNASELLFEKKDGVFKRIADRAKRDPYYVPIGTKLKDYKVIKSNDDIVELWSEKTKSIRYVPFQLIKDLMDGIASNKISVDDIKKRRDLDLPTLLNSKVEKYYFGIEGTLYNICEYLIENQNKATKQNYVIIIDEINRANISRVFGELITLIEPDKRSHGNIPLEAKLPSGDPFIVPSNLFIIGTMNTADKSIALLDIALRRRFEFESMYPKYEITGQEIYDVEILKKINEQIIKSKGHDFQIGHAYFMGDNKDLVQRMNKKVIPLLLEYYMNDEKEVKKILNSAGLKIEENSWPLKISGKND
ncbi:MAG: AAA family ATPase [Flavobacteriales bacterium]|nr:AAA family ATPase [Flavobacteriales bacterium]